ncbi:MAG: bifunctional metallophosphatase/5'-nucleotidase [Bifidobacteriaceae bacterium]|nr:bifunctional metallophosphatase/5'-nucleotidase [Bifidobacteriaceae bacterium]
MKIFIKSFIFIFSLFPALIPISTTKAQAEEIPWQRLRIIYTNDLHSHIDPYKAFNSERQVINYGGYAKMASIINQNQQTNIPTITLDGGDFTVGSIYNILFTSQAPDLQMLNLMKFDATTLGNHEFDYGSNALAKMISTGYSKTKIIASNTNAPQNGHLGQLFQKGEIVKNTIIDKNGIKIGLLGLLGHDAVSDIVNSNDVTFQDYIDAAKEQVKLLKQNGADIIIALSHSGVNKNNLTGDSSEDVALAKQVPEINFILSAHTHVFTPTPIIIGKTIISSTGAYAQNIGLIDLEKDNSNWQLTNSQMLPVTDNYSNNKQIKDLAQKYKSQINKDFFSKYSLNTNKIITETNFNLGADTSTGYDEGIGRIFTDAFGYEFTKYAAFIGQKGNLVNKSQLPILLTANGVSRGGFFKPNISVEDIYGAVNMGFGPDKSHTYPLCAFYVKGDELKQVMEIGQSVGELLKDDIIMHFGNIKYTYSNYRLPGNRVSEVWIKNTAGDWEKPNSDKLYPIITNYYIGQMAGSIPKLTFGLMNVQPKKADGSLACKGTDSCDLSDSVLLNKSGSEIKEWQALVNYLGSFKTLPEYYAKADSGKIELSASNPYTYISNPNKIFFSTVIILCLIFAFVPLITFPIKYAVSMLIYTIIKNRRKSKLRKTLNV